MTNSSRRDTVELKRPRARLNLLLLVPALAVLSAAGIFANPGRVVSMSPAAHLTKIESDLTLDKRITPLSTKGHVHLQNFARDECSLRSDVLKVCLTRNLDDLTSAVATGNVRVGRGPSWLSANEAVLDAATHTIVLTGSPAVHDAAGITPEKRIVIHLDTELLEMDPQRA